MTHYLSRHPAELQGAKVKSETLWNQWFTVKSVNGINGTLQNNEATTEQIEPANCVKENDGVNRVNEAKGKQPIKSLDERNSRELNKWP